ncbi:MAG: hypothetical protein GY856_43020 [bacterium]|nr:hypothetical protein [bacterium]
MKWFRQTLRSNRVFILTVLAVNVFYMVEGARLVEARQLRLQEEERHLQEFSMVFDIPMEKLRGERESFFDPVRKLMVDEVGPAIEVSYGRLQKIVRQGKEQAVSHLSQTKAQVGELIGATKKSLSSFPQAQIVAAFPQERPSPIQTSETERVSRAPRSRERSASSLGASGGIPLPLQRVAKKVRTEEAVATAGPRAKSTVQVPPPVPRQVIPKDGIAPEIVALAESLGNSPADIFSLVHDSIDFDPKWGVHRSPLGTLHEGRGTAWDQAWLLQQLLTAASVDARFQWGEIEIPTAILLNLTGVEDPWQAGNLMTTAGVPIVLVVQGSQVLSARMSHVWLTAHIDFIPNRGMTPGPGDTWVRMDDADGRLARHVDAFGKVIEYDHRLADHQEIVTDRLGNSRLLGYDGRGNVVRQVDALGKETLRTFDGEDNLLSETDALGHTTSYSYSASNDLLSVTDPLGNTTAYTYDGSGRVLTVTDPRGKVTSNTYDGNGNLLSTTEPTGATTSFTYDWQGNVLTETDAAGHTPTFAYDGRGNLTSQVDAVGTATSYTYDAAGNRLSETTSRTLPDGSPETLVTSFVYDSLGRLTTTTQPDGSTTSTGYDALGQVISTTDPLGRVTSFTYDQLGKQTGTTYPGGTSESRTYDAAGRLATVTDRRGWVTTYLYDAAGRLTTTLFVDGTSTQSVYDDAGRLSATIDARGNTTNYFYDAAGRRTRVVDALGGQTHFVYDAAGNQVAVTDPSRHTTSFVYDDASRLVRTVFPDGTERTTGYDVLGRRVSKTDQAGKTTQFGYDDLGRLTSVTDALGQVTSYAYNELGNRTGQTDANGHLTSFEYDRLGRQTKRTLPGGDFETMAYDVAGNLATATDFLGRTTTYAYDAANRLVTKTLPDSSTVTYGYTVTGRRSSVTDRRGVTSSFYDDRDRLVEMVYPDGRRLTYGYDAAGNRTSLTAHVAGQVLTTSYTYDASNRLDTVTDPGGRLYDHGYDANGNRVSLAYPNGVATSYVYDQLNRLTDLSTTTSVGDVVQSYAYTLGPAGNRTRIDEHDGTVRSYGYEDLYRLATETVSDVSGTVYAKTFGYDPVGNRLSQVTTGAGAETVAYSYDDRDRLVDEGGQVYGWDANGNLATKAAEATYGWDFEDRLESVVLADGTLVAHTYDADGVRVRTESTPPGGPTQVVNYLLDISGALSQVVAETDGAGSLKAYYVRGDDLLAVIRLVTGVRFYHADGLGSIRALTDDTEAVTDRWSFTAFGELLEHVGSDENAYLFAGEPLDPNFGFYYNRARWMDPGVGRFASLDRFGGVLSDPISLHKYLYAGNNPANAVDPTGHFTSVGETLQIIAVQVVIAAPYIQTEHRASATRSCRRRGCALGGRTLDEGHSQVNLDWWRSARHDGLTRCDWRLVEFAVRTRSLGDAPPTEWLFRL